MNTEITFVTRDATIGAEVFPIDQEKLDDFPYRLDVNRIPASPTHIHPGEEGDFFRIPTPLYEREGNREIITGIVVIRCRDILDHKHIRFQDFRASLDARTPSGIVLTFGDERSENEARKALGALSGMVPGLGAESRLESMLRQLARNVADAIRHMKRYQ